MEACLALGIMGVVQGIAEFLPVSSSGHLVLIGQTQLYKSGVAVHGDGIMLLLSVVLHLATLCAVLVFLRRELLLLAKGVVNAILAWDFRTVEFRVALYTVVATIPAGVVGMLFHDFFEKLFSSSTPVYFMLILNGFILLSTKIIPLNDRKIDQMGIFRSVCAGLFQAFAIFPGISRSGLTITGGLLLGLRPEDAARFSFLMAIPVIAGAAALEVSKVGCTALPGDILLPTAAACLLCFAVALVSIKALFTLVRRMRIDMFGYYTIALGCAGIVYRIFS